MVQTKRKRSRRQKKHMRQKRATCRRATCRRATCRKNRATPRGGQSPLQLKVNYSSVVVANQDLTGQAAIYNSKPTITLENAEPNKAYLITMTDPDAPDGTYTHYVLSVKDGKYTQYYAYQPPTPPKGTGLHHYVFNVYANIPAKGQLTGNDYYQAVLAQNKSPLTPPIQFTVKN